MLFWKSSTFYQLLFAVCQLNYFLSFARGVELVHVFVRPMTECFKTFEFVGIFHVSVKAMLTPALIVIILKSKWIFSSGLLTIIIITLKRNSSALLLRFS
jgi:hypothetical protein